MLVLIMIDTQEHELALNKFPTIAFIGLVSEPTTAEIGFNLKQNYVFSTDFVINLPKFPLCNILT